MTKFDGTGPQGLGPTGLRRGKCDTTATQNVFFGRGCGFGRRRCYFWGRSQNQVLLEKEEEILTQRLDSIRKTKKNKE